MTKKRQPTPKRRAKFCLCGCGEKFTPLRSNQVFFAPAHKKDYWAKRFNTFSQKDYQTFLAHREFFNQVIVHRVAIEQFLKRRKKRHETQAK